jgi:prophage DNA circulation protein
MEVVVDEDEQLSSLVQATAKPKKRNPDDYAKYEVVLDCKVKAVVYANDEADAIEKAKQNKVEKEFEWLGSGSAKEVPDEDTRVVIKNIVGKVKEFMDDKKFCPECEEYKPAKGFKKDKYRSELVCADCYNDR